MKVGGEYMDIYELKKNLEHIKNKEYVESKRKGNTGVGYTLETLLGIKENNLKTSDFEKIELKSQRKNVSNKITLFTFNRAVWKIPQKELIERYGYVDTNGRKSLYCTVNTKPNNQGLYLSVHDTTLNLNHVDGTLVAEWKISNLIETFEKKMPVLVIVFADTRINSNEKEEFWYNEAYFLEHPDVDNFIHLIKNDKIIVDIRMHLKNNNSTVRNHGTAFRIDEQFLYLCFGKKERLI